MPALNCSGIDGMIAFELVTLNAPAIYLALYGSKVSAGFPSPAEEHVEQRLSPNDYLIDQQDATFFVTIQGYSMIDVGLLPKDKVVVDRSKKPTMGNIVVAVVDGEFTIKILSRKKDGTPILLAANASGDYAPIEIKEGMSFEVWGVVIGSFRRFI
jgi:DNA polymerase V